MKNLLSTAIVMLVVSSMVAGCSDSAEPQETEKAAIPPKVSSVTGEASSEKHERGEFDKLPEDAVIVSVNGKELTKGTFLKWVALRKKLIGSSMRSQMNGADPAEIIKEQMLATVTNDYVRQIVASDYAKETGLVAGTNQIEMCRRGFMQTARISGMSWEKVLKKFSAIERETINDRIMAEATMVAVQFDFYAKNNVEVGQEEIDALYVSYLEYNRKCAASNEVVWANASNIWNRAVSGERFEDLAIQFDEDEYRTPDGIWGDFQVSNFTDEPKIWKLTTRFRPGYISPPVEADNGIVILKINSIEDEGYDVNAAGYVPSPAAEINMSRIFIHLPLFYEEMDKKQFAKQCQAAKKIAEFNKFLQERISKADIRYPRGTKIFGQGEGDLQMPFMAQ